MRTRVRGRRGGSSSIAPAGADALIELMPGLEWRQAGAF